ncbi:MAG: hypothetical protein IH851_10625 [Armatimonadetes bacterium]|nr:hypothetical protein [Armatimonadota bacterium]
MDSSRIRRAEAIGRDRPPALVQAVAYATVAVGLFWLVRLAVPLFSTHYAYDVARREENVAWLGEALLLSMPTLIFAALAARLLWLRHRWGRYLTIIYWAFSFAGFHGLFRGQFIDPRSWGTDSGPQFLWAWDNNMWNLHPISTSLVFLVSITALAGLCWLLFAHPSFETQPATGTNERDFIRPNDANARRTGWRFVKLVVLSVIMYLLLALADVVSLLSDFVGRFTGFNYMEGPTLPAFLGAAALLLFMSSRRLDVNARKVSLYLGNRALTLFEVPWFRVRRIVVIEHNRHPRTAVFYYDSRFLLPFSMAIHAKRWQNGEQVIDKALDLARGYEIPIVLRRSPDFIPWLAWGVILAGLACGFVMAFLWTETMQSYADGEIGFKQVGTMPQPIRFAALITASTVLPLLGLGLLSAFHRGTGRPVLLFMYAGVLTVLPTGYAFWYVWMAIYAILTGILQPVTQLPHIPLEPLRNWELAFSMLTWSPIVGLAAYFLGVFIGQRRVRVEIAAPRPDVSD